MTGVVESLWDDADSVLIVFDPLQDVHCCWIGQCSGSPSGLVALFSSPVIHPETDSSYALARRMAFRLPPPGWSWWVTWVSVGWIRSRRRRRRGCLPLLTFEDMTCRGPQLPERFSLPCGSSLHVATGMGALGWSLPLVSLLAGLVHGFYIPGMLCVAFLGPLSCFSTRLVLLIVSASSWFPGVLCAGASGPLLLMVLVWPLCFSTLQFPVMWTGVFCSGLHSSCIPLPVPMVLLWPSSYHLHRLVLGSHLWTLLLGFLLRLPSLSP